MTEEILSFVRSPYGTNEKCTLQNTKKTQFYIHKYNPERILNNVINTFSSFGYNDEQINEIVDIFDTEQKINCCNVISITLYCIFRENSSDLKDMENIDIYMKSIKKTIKNVQKCLKDWIVRIYLDISCFNAIKKAEKYEGDDKYNKKIKESILESFNFIINNEITEIYTITCQNDATKNIHRKRTLRFLSLIDPEVNACILREADGTVSVLDCHNINIFVNSDKLFYFALAGKFMTNECLSYSVWLNAFIRILKYGGNHDYCHQYDMLAGATGINFKVKPDIYYINIEKTQSLIEY
jgi:hypothetical protein